MDMKVKLHLHSNTIYKEYIRTNSYWYKTLNRNPNMTDLFIKEVKEKYKLTMSDKINNVMDKIDMISKFMNVLR